MNKKLLFAAMSLAALTACTDNDFESKNVANVAGETSPVQFEVINVNDAEGTRASMDGNKVVWSATDGDLFTLYHGAVLGNIAGHENATYTASLGDDGTAVLTTPSMIKTGGAVMVWPVDTTFYYDIAGELTIKIPAVQGGEDEDGNDIIQYQIPYVSDEIDIDVYGPFDNDPTSAGYNEYNSAGKDRKYKVFMRPMASQLNLIADYAGTDATLATLYGGDDPIDPIKLTSVDLLTTTGGGTTDFTQEIGVQFTAPTPAITTQWAGVANNAWNNVTDFDLTNIVTDVDQLTTESLKGNESCKFLILPQNTIPAAGVDDGGVVVNTIYGKVVIANVADADNHGTMYTAGATGEIEDAWYRFVTDPTAIVAGETAAAAPEASGEHAGKYKVTSEPKIGMEQTINAFSANKAASGVVKGEPQGAAATRYVKVLLTHLDMSDLHIKTDKQLYDAVRVWEKMALPSVEVYLDGDAKKQFEISQKTIKKINEINAAAAGARFFGVKPCNTHTCDEIVVTGGDKIEDMTFIFLDGTHDADVVLKGGETWKWDGTVKIAAPANTGISGIINRGTLENAAANILNIKNPAGTAVVDIPFKNDLTGKWNITAGRIRVQNDVENLGTLTISKGAQFIEDDAFGIAATFTNNAKTLENRFIGGSGQKIGTVINNGVFATLGTGVINNYSLIEHADKDAKTYITHNETTSASFATAFGAGNKKGRINLPYSNKDEDNISISADPIAPFEGFISVTVDGDADTPTLDAATVGTFVNYMIVKSGIDDIAYLPSQVEYVEVDTDHEVYWSIPTATLAGGLIVLSDVNVKLGTTLDATTATYLGKEMYVGGTFTTGSWNGYYGATGTRVAEHYITY